MFMLCFMLMNSVILNLMYGVILFQSTSSHSCFQFQYMSVVGGSHTRCAMFYQQQIGQESGDDDDDDDDDDDVVDPGTPQCIKVAAVSEVVCQMVPLPCWRMAFGFDLQSGCQSAFVVACDCFLTPVKNYASLCNE